MCPPWGKASTFSFSLRMCVPTRLYHPSRHKWRTVREKCLFQLWIAKHILAQRILTVTILCYCLCPVATGLSQRCFPGKECGIAAPPVLLQQLHQKVLRDGELEQLWGQWVFNHRGVQRSLWSEQYRWVLSLVPSL